MTWKQKIETKSSSNCGDITLTSNDSNTVLSENTLLNHLNKLYLGAKPTTSEKLTIKKVNYDEEKDKLTKSFRQELQQKEFQDIKQKLFEGIP